MSTYHELRGLKVKYLAADPDPGTAGDVWYNTSTFQLKGFVGRAAWSAGALLSTGRRFLGGTGTQTSALAFAGYDGTALSVVTEEYNGSGWSTGGNLNDGKEGVAGFGVQTASVSVGGKIPGVTSQVEEYDGSSWTEVTDVPAVIAGGAGAGTLTAGLFFGGSVPGKSNVTLEYDGTNWTSGGNLNTARGYLGGLGTQTAASAIAGLGPAPGNVTIQEQYDGSSWTEVGDMNTARRSLGASGSTTAALGFAGYTSTAVANTELWDGSAWTEVADIGTARYRVAAGTSSPAKASIVFGGGPGAKANTEEFNVTIMTVTAGAWASGGNMSVSRYGGAGGGTPTAAWYATGRAASLGPGYSSATEEYDGSSWTAGGDIADTTTQSTGSCGTLTAGLKFGGQLPNAAKSSEIESYDGSSWTALAADLSDDTGGTSGSGTQTASLYTRGRPSTVNEEYNGTSWSSANTISTTGRSGTNAGTQTAGLYIGGEIPPGPYALLVDEYDGTNWTAGGNLVIPQGASSNSGPQTDCLAASGYTTDSPWGPSNIEECQIYDGTAWATSPNVATAISSGSSSNRGTGGGSNGALKFSGNTVATEEFTAETSAINLKTITDS